MLDFIIRAGVAIVAYTIQCQVLGAVLGRKTRTWLLLIGGVLVTGISTVIVPFPVAGLTALIFYFASTLEKSPKQALLAATFTAFSFALMVHISQDMIISAFLPGLLNSGFLGYFAILMACTLWWSYTHLLQMDYHLMEDVDQALPWHQSIAFRLNLLAVLYFLTEFWFHNLWITLAFLLLTGFTLSELSFRYKTNLKESIHDAQKDHISLLQNSSNTINHYYQEKADHELFMMDEAENLYDLIRFNYLDQAREQVDYLLEPSPNSKRVDPLYKEKLEQLHLEAVRNLFEAKYLQARDTDIWVSMEIPETISKYPINPLDWVTALTDILDHAIAESSKTDNRYLSYAYFTDADSQHFVLECSCHKPNAPISEGLSDAGLERASEILGSLPEVTLVSSARNGIYRIQIEFDMTKGGYHA